MKNIFWLLALLLPWTASAAKPRSIALTIQENEELSPVIYQLIGKIQTVEAGEFLVMVLRQEAGNLREAAYQSLAQMDNADVIPILRQHHEIETNPQVRDTLGELLRRH